MRHASKRFESLPLVNDEYISHVFFLFYRRQPRDFCFNLFRRNLVAAIIVERETEEKLK